MEKFSAMQKIIETLRFPIEINIPQYFFDHQFAGKTVVPAVESCQILANNLKKYFPEVNNQFIYTSSFNKFLEIEQGQDVIHAFNDIEVYEDGTIVSKLSTKTKALKSGITRINEHAILQFKKHDQHYNEITFDKAAALDGICLKINSKDIYKDLVGFGPAFQNIAGDLFVTDDGAIGNVSAPLSQTYEDLPLGSPFVFDAALHAANCWGQRYYNIVAFPVGFKRRIILSPTLPGEKFFVRVIPILADKSDLIFDIWIYDKEGTLREAGLSVILKDVNSEKLIPPKWISERKSVLENIAEKCEALSIIEIDSIPDFSHKALTHEELHRLGPMKEKRRKSYTGARLACKFLSRKLSIGENTIPANKINTVINNIYPVCPLSDGSTPHQCSVSHDSRFVIAVASRKRIGVDVEEINERILNVKHMFTSNEENNIVNEIIKQNKENNTSLNGKEAYLRIWTIKEAVTKSLKISFPDSWKLVQVNTIGKNISTFLINNIEINAYHDTVDNHLFTIVEQD